MLRVIVNAASAGNESAGQQLLELAARYRDPREPSPDEAPAFMAEFAAVPGGAAVIERGIHIYRPTRGDPDSALPLHRLLERQHYRAAYWRLAGSDINYRRFFDINDLAGLRVEDMDTFRRVHALVARLIADDKLQGLRLDHIDGLWDPIQYCRRLQRLIRAAQGARRGFHVTVEKILAHDERMPDLPGVAGTTGYEWLNVISRVLVNDAGLEPLDRFRRETTDNPRPFRQILERAKLRVLENLLTGEFNVLVRLLGRIAAGHYRTRDFAVTRLEAALRLFILEFPVYRTYVTASGPSATDRAIIDRTIAAARARWFGPDIEIFEFLRDTLTLDLVAPERAGYSGARVRRFALKFQQFTGPMLAKSLEDTAFYRYYRLLALNEVGGDPALGGLGADDFHALMRRRLARAPHGLTATATHDTKRGEDARARMLAIAELGDDWVQAVAEWRRFNERFTMQVNGLRAPSTGLEYMLYQTMLGAWPLDRLDDSFVERMELYAIKAAREGKVETSWINPNEAYESAIRQFLRRVLERKQSEEFIARFATLARRAALLGALNSLSQVTLKAMMPGVPDFYQGSELWDLSLVDPDNRRPVDFALRARLFEQIAPHPDWASLAAAWPDGRVKFALTRELIRLRHAHAALFTNGSYHPVAVSGTHRDHVLAFARTRGRDAVVVAVGRLFAPFTEGGRTWPAPAQWDATLQLEGFAALRDALVPHRSLPESHIPVSRLFDPVPVAILRGSPVRKPVSRRPRESVAEPMAAV